MDLKLRQHPLCFTSTVWSRWINNTCKVPIKSGKRLWQISNSQWSGQETQPSLKYSEKQIAKLKLGVSFPLPNTLWVLFPQNMQQYRRTVTDEKVTLQLFLLKNTKQQIVKEPNSVTWSLSKPSDSLISSQINVFIFPAIHLISIEILGWNGINKVK